MVLAVQTLWLATAFAADPGSSKLTEELSKQEQIIRSQGEKRPEGYVIDRSLLSYTHTLPAEFDRSLADLGSKDRWLDIGAGRGQAILDYFAERYDSMHPDGRGRRGRKAQAVAMSIEDRRTPLWQQTAADLGADKIRYLTDKRLRDYSLQELGRFHIITDVIGGFSYTQDLTLFMEKTLEFLEPNGSFYTVLQDVHSEEGTNKPYYAGAPFLTEITNADGSEVKICSWLKSISCVEVTCELRSGWIPPIEVYRVRKVCNGVTVPTLVPIHFEAGTPPERGFKLKN